MLNTQNLSLEQLHEDPHNPRQEFCPEALRALAENLLSLGQQIPLLVSPLKEGGFQIVDGHRRLRAAKLGGIPTLTCLVMLENYTESDLRLTQLSIETHKVGMTFLERSDLLQRIKDQSQATVTQMAKAVGIDQGTVTKLLSLQRLDQEFKNLVQARGLTLEQAYFISREPDVQKQRELARAVTGLKREQLRQRVKPPSAIQEVEVQSAKATFLLPAGGRLMLDLPELTMSRAIETLLGLARDLKRAMADNLNIKTAQQVFKDRAKALPAC